MFASLRTASTSLRMLAASATPALRSTFPARLPRHRQRRAHKLEVALLAQPRLPQGAQHGSFEGRGRACEYAKIPHGAELSQRLHAGAEERLFGVGRRAGAVAEAVSGVGGNFGVVATHDCSRDNPGTEVVHFEPAQHSLGHLGRVPMNIDHGGCSVGDVAQHPTQEEERTKVRRKIDSSWRGAPGRSECGR